MLQTMRNRTQSWVAKALVGFIALTFALWGLESLVPVKNDDLVVTVEGEKISQQTLLQAMERKRAQLMNMQGADFNPALLDEKILESITLNDLINSAVLKAKIDELNMVIAGPTLNQEIVRMPEFKAAEGNFDADRFNRLLASLGMTLADFKRYLADELMVVQLKMGVMSSNFTTPEAVNDLDNLYNQTRTVSWLTLGSGVAEKLISVSDDDIAAYYNSHSNDYKTKEQVKVDYLLLNKQTLKNRIEITEDDLKTLYDARIAEIKDQHARSAALSIIVFEQEKEGLRPKERADAVYKKLQAGDAFAELAKIYSDDRATAAEGGMLGAVEPGFFGTAFDEVITALPINHFSQPVQTDFGFVLINKAQEEAFKIPSLASMKEELITEEKERSADLVYVEKMQRLADVSFESVDLEQPMEMLDLEIKTTDFFDRAGGKGVAAEPKFIATAFSEDVINAGLNSELIELSKGQSVVMRLKSHKVPVLRPLKEVTSSIAGLLKQVAIHKLQQEEARNIVAMLQEGKSIDAISSAFKLHWSQSKTVTRGQSDIDRQLVNRIFKLPKPSEDIADGKFVFANQKLSNGDMSVLKLEAVGLNPSTLTDAQRRQLGISIAQSDSDTVFTEVLNLWRSVADITYNNTENSENHGGQS